MSLEKKKGPENVVKRPESKGSVTPIKKGMSDENSTQFNSELSIFTLLA